MLQGGAGGAGGARGDGGDDSEATIMEESNEKLEEDDVNIVVDDLSLVSLQLFMGDDRDNDKENCFKRKHSSKRKRERKPRVLSYFGR